MWNKLTDKNFWANALAVTMIVAILGAIGYSNFRSWQKNTEMIRHINHIETVVEEMVEDHMVASLDFVNAVYDTWVVQLGGEEPFGPYGGNELVSFAFCQPDSQAEAPENFRGDIRNVIGFYWNEENKLHLVLWGRDNKISIKRALKP